MIVPEAGRGRSLRRRLEEAARHRREVGQRHDAGWGGDDVRHRVGHRHRRVGSSQAHEAGLGPVRRRQAVQHGAHVGHRDLDHVPVRGGFGGVVCSPMIQVEADADDVALADPAAVVAMTPPTVPARIVMKPRSLSPVAAVNSTSKVIRSSDAPIASAIIAADSAKTSLSRRTLSARPGVSGAAKPIARCVSALSYVERSTDSVIRISSTRSHEPLSTIPTRFVMPGWAPLPKIVEPPRSQAERIRSKVRRALRRR